MPKLSGKARRQDQLFLDWSAEPREAPPQPTANLQPSPSQLDPPAPSRAVNCFALPKISREAAAVIHAHLPPPNVEQYIATPATERISEPKTKDEPKREISDGGRDQEPIDMAARSDLVQVLPWDFRTSFPAPSEEAIESGKTQEEDAEGENLRALHEEHARHALTLLADRDAVMDARRMGIDPATGRPPRTPAKKERLEKLFATEPQRLEHAFEVLMDVYEEVFGPEATDAFRKAIRARHAGVEVISEEAPAAAPLPESVEGGVFGTEEDGTVVCPSQEEIFEITSELAENLEPLEEPDARQASLTKYAEDFGGGAAEEIDRWVRLKVQSEEIAVAEYDPAHPWHYYSEGDHASPLPVADIPAQALSLEQFGVKWPKDSRKRRNLMQQMLDSQRKQLVEDEKRYQELIGRGVDALSQYDREIAHRGDEELAWATAISLKYCHISGTRGRIRCIEQALGINAEKRINNGK